MNLQQKHEDCKNRLSFSTEQEGKIFTWNVIKCKDEIIVYAVWLSKYIHHWRKTVDIVTDLSKILQDVGPCDTKMTPTLSHFMVEDYQLATAYTNV